MIVLIYVPSQAKMSFSFWKMQVQQYAYEEWETYGSF